MREARGARICEKKLTAKKRKKLDWRFEDQGKETGVMV